MISGCAGKNCSSIINGFEYVPRKFRAVMCEPWMVTFTNSKNGGTTHIANSYTREQLLNEAADVFLKKDSQVYHVVNRVRNMKGETTGITYILAKNNEKNKLVQALLKLFKFVK